MNKVMRLNWHESKAQLEEVNQCEEETKVIKRNDCKDMLHMVITSDKSQNQFSWQIAKNVLSVGY